MIKPRLIKTATLSEGKPFTLTFYGYQYLLINCTNLNDRFNKRKWYLAGYLRLLAQDITATNNKVTEIYSCRLPLGNSVHEIPEEWVYLGLGNTGRLSLEIKATVWIKKLHVAIYGNPIIKAKMPRISLDFTGT